MSRPFVMVGVWAHPEDETYLGIASMHRVTGRGGSKTSPRTADR